ncbi:hypothetical protein [Sulfitobacter sp. SH24]|uniref:hypothetical protein n=1 Tax=Sulfitobacter sp. SH24 TaxID=3421173 RepID=UPI003F4F5205
MPSKILPPEKWEISFSNGKLILSAAVQIMEDGSEFLSHKAFSLVDDGSDYPAGLDDLESARFTVNEIDSISGSGEHSKLHARNLLGETVKIADNLKLLIDIDGVARAFIITA